MLTTTTPDVYSLSVRCIHRQDPSWCWACADLRAEFRVLDLLTTGPRTLAELADPEEPERWLGGGLASALLRLRAAGRVDLVGGRFRAADEGGKGGGIGLESKKTIGIDAHARQDQGPDEGAAGCSRSRRRCENS